MCDFFNNKNFFLNFNNLYSELFYCFFRKLMEKILKYFYYLIKKIVFFFWGLLRDLKVR